MPSIRFQNYSINNQSQHKTNFCIFCDEPIKDKILCIDCSIEKFKKISKTKIFENYKKEKSN